MSNRPSTFLKDTSLVWVMRLYDPADGVTLIDADSTPTVAVRKNGSAVGDSVTVTKRAATTGIYDCSYNPASEVVGDQFTLEESTVIGGDTYENNFSVAVFTNDVSATSANKIADHVLRRNQANVEASSDGDTLSVNSLYGLIQQAQESDVSGSTMTIKKTNGTDVLGTKTVATDSAAPPITGVS